MGLRAGHRRLPAARRPLLTRTGREQPVLPRARAQGDANWVMSEPFLMSAVLTPVLGHLVDNRGGRATLCLLSALACLLVHLLLGLTALPAKVLLIGLGL